MLAKNPNTKKVIKEESAFTHTWFIIQSLFNNQKISKITTAITVQSNK
jgi:hypothetical protein